MDPIVLALLVIAALLTWGQVQARMSPSLVSEAGEASRLFELHWALDPRLGAKPSEKPHANRWDNAVEAVVCFEGGAHDEAVRCLPNTPDGSFRACWEAAYGSGPFPAARERKQVMRGLGDGLAAKLLDAALEKKAGGDSDDARRSAMDHYRRRAYVVFSAFFLALAGAAAGVWVGVRMFARRSEIASKVGTVGGLAYRTSGTMVIRVFLAWYIVFLSSATIAAWIDAAVPLGPFTLPVAYLLHSVFGLGLVARAEGISLAALWKKIAPKESPWLKNGLKYLLLALTCALLLNLVMSPFLPDGEPPQKDLVGFIRGLNSVVPFVTVFGTVALLGPFFEEVFFRGFLLPTMRRRMSPAAAILLSGAMFGAVHLQPLAFPTLAVLGSLLGLVFLATRDIRAAILVHACWNGGAFILQRMLLS